MTERTNGNVFVFSFSEEGFEAIVNLTAVDETSVLAKLSDEPATQSVDAILNMMTLRARFNSARKMEVWLVKLDESFTEEYLVSLAEDDPQLVANLARMGEQLTGEKPGLHKKVIV